MHHRKGALRAALLGGVLACAMASQAGALCLGVGTVTGDALRLRAESNTDSDILDTVSGGTDVLVLDDTGSGWYEVEYRGVDGFMSADYLAVSENAPADLGTGNVSAGGFTLNLRSGPGTGYDKLADLPDGTEIPLSGVADGWFKTSYNGVEGYVSSDYVSLDGSDVASGASGNAGNWDLRSQVVSFAKQYLGTPYVYGASSGSAFDCSGFTSFVFRNFGYTLNRSAAGQCADGVAIESSQIQPGDLMLWRAYGSSKAATHAGIYIGNNQYIHASSTKGCVVIDDMNYADSTRYLVGVRRILN